MPARYALQCHKPRASYLGLSHVPRIPTRQSQVRVVSQFEFDADLLNELRESGDRGCAGDEVELDRMIKIFHDLQNESCPPVGSPLIRNRCPSRSSTSISRVCHG